MAIGQVMGIILKQFVFNKKKEKSNLVNFSFFILTKTAIKNH